MQLGRANVLAAEIAVADNNLDAAKEHLDQAERLLGRSPEPIDLCTLRTIQGRWAARSGQPDEAIAFAQEALALGGTEAGERAEATWGLAEAYAVKGLIEKAVESFESSIELYIEDKRLREATRVCRAYASALRVAGREKDAFDVLERAADLAVKSSATR
jgi:tetratricopeptide (TPR) repeat protein